MKGVTIGIDISHDLVKVVGLLRKGNNFQLVGLGNAPVPANSWTTDELKNQAEIAEAIKSVMKACKPAAVSGKHAMFAFPESVVFSGTFALPIMSEKELEQAAPFEIAEKLSINPDDYYIDYELADSNCKPVNAKEKPAKKLPLKLEDPKNAQPTNSVEPLMTLFAVAAKKTLVHSVMELCETLKLELAGIDIKPGATVRSVVPSSDQKARIIVDLGASATIATVAEGKSLRLTTTIPIGARELFGAEGQASPANLREKMSPIFDELVHVTKYFENHVCPNVRIEEILLTGGGSNNEAAIDVFRQETGLTTVRGNPATNIELHHFPLPQQLASTYAEAIGLAMREAHE